MRLPLLAILICFSLLGQAQDLTKKLTSLQRVKVSDGIQLKLVKATENKLEVSVRNFDVDDLKIDLKSGELHIRSKPFKNTGAATIEATLYFKNLRGIKALGKASVVMQDKLDTLKVNYMELEASNGSTISLPILAEDLTVQSNTGASIVLKGFSTNQKVMVTGGGTYDAKEMKSYTGDVDVRAGGTAVVTVYDNLFAKVAAGGTIRYAGNPEEYEEAITAGGKIERIE